MSIRFGCFALLLATFCGAASAQVTDFAIDTSGPHHVVQGHYMFFMTQGRILAGTDEPGTVPSVSGLPGGATAEFVDMTRNCCGTNLWSLPDGNPLKISTSSSTPIGTYPLTITYKTPEGVQRSTTYTIYVDPLPTLVQKAGTYYPPDTPLSSLAQWNSNMTTYGRKHCTPDEMVFWDGDVWFYDGTRVYYQIADHTGDPSWNACAQMVANFYQQHVLTVGVPAGYYIFSQGLAMNYQRTGDPVSLQVVHELGQEFYAQWPDVKYIIPWSLSRELSYGIESALVDQSQGAVLNPHFQDLIEVLLGDFDQWFVSKNSDYTQPFMVALAAEALINYYNLSHDPRIPPVLQMAADQLWPHSWDPTSKSFTYYNADGTTTSSLDLSLLIAPLYGWVFQQTGFQGYRDMGDQIFNAGVPGAWLDGGKQFSQSYRWSAQYVQWRSVSGVSQQTLQALTGSSLALFPANSLTPGPVASESIVTARGSQLADGTASAVTPVPTELANCTVTVRDATGGERVAGLYYVSPGQIDFTIPAGTAPGMATITVYHGGQIRASGTVEIDNVAPSLFTLNGSLATASVELVTNGSASSEPTAAFDLAAGGYVPVPIDVGSGFDQVSLTLYGTGWRHRSSLIAVNVSIAGLQVPVVFAGDSGVVDGLDIVTVLLPQQLRGQGLATIALTVDSIPANTVQVTIK